MAPSKIDIKEWLVRISEYDDQEAFKLLFDQYFDQMLNFSISYVKQTASAEDIIADVFLRIWKNRNKLSEIENFKAYLFTCVRNESLKFLKKKQKPEMSINDEIYHPNLVSNCTPEAEYEFEELNRKFNAAIEQLPDQCKQTFILVKQQKLKYKEVAEILGISHKTVDAHLVKAVKRLRKIFESYRLNQHSDK